MSQKDLRFGRYLNKQTLRKDITMSVDVCNMFYFELALLPHVRRSTQENEFFVLFSLFYMEVISGNFLNITYYNIFFFYMKEAVSYMYKFTNLYQNGRPFCWCSNKSKVYLNSTTWVFFTIHCRYWLSIFRTFIDKRSHRLLKWPNWF